MMAYTSANRGERRKQKAKGGGERDQIKFIDFDFMLLWNDSETSPH